MRLASRCFSARSVGLAAAARQPGAVACVWTNVWWARGRCGARRARVGFAWMQGWKGWREMHACVRACVWRGGMRSHSSAVSRCARPARRARRAQLRRLSREIKPAVPRRAWARRAVRFKSLFKYQWRARRSSKLRLCSAHSRATDADARSRERRHARLEAVDHPDLHLGLSQVLHLALLSLMRNSKGI